MDGNITKDDLREFGLSLAEQLKQIIKENKDRKMIICIQNGLRL